MKTNINSFDKTEPLLVSKPLGQCLENFFVGSYIIKFLFGEPCLLIIHHCQESSVATALGYVPKLSKIS